ncbi:hypothetical protein [Nonomuraea endophytica]|uniref:hypothetical protein n=1 Tax=Nonomuraea endophytica TaxID=714136 RepID=UPI0037CC8A6E
MMSVKRQTVPLDVEDTKFLSHLRDSDAYRATLSKLSDRELAEEASEAALLSALLAAGRAAVEERVAITGYTAWADDMSEEDLDYRAAMRNRRRDRGQ